MQAVASLLALTVCVAALANHDPSGYVYHEHTLTRPYDGIHDRAHWTFHGSTLVSDKYVRLTPDRQSRRGSIWSTVPFSPVSTTGEDAEFPPWEMILEFHVHGSGKKLFGDGFAVWYTKDRAIEGPVFGNTDQFVGLGVFFDTYSNMQQGHQQYISVMLSDGSTPYDQASDGGDAKIAGCPIDFRGREHAYSKLVVQDGLLRVYVDVAEQGWQECFVVRNIHLPRGYYFGLSAATGDLADNHDILSVKVAEPSPMPDVERLAIMKRIADDIKDHVEQLPHRDPQYDPALVGPEDAFPAYMLIIAVVVVILIAVAVIFLAAKEQRHASTHFT